MKSYFVIHYLDFFIEMNKNMSWVFELVLCWVSAVFTNQGVDKSLDQKCEAKTKPSKVGFVSYFDFVFFIY